MTTELYNTTQEKCNLRPENVSVYGLIDPRDCTIRYIGQTINPEKRLHQHISDLSETSKAAWIADLRTLGLEPSIVILKKAATRADANYVENWWIVLARKQGWDLRNGTNPKSHKFNFSEMFSSALTEAYNRHADSIVELNGAEIRNAVKRHEGSIETFSVSFAGITAVLVSVWMFTGERIVTDGFTAGVVWSCIFVVVGWLIRSIVSGVKNESNHR